MPNFHAPFLHSKFSLSIDSMTFSILSHFVKLQFHLYMFSVSINHYVLSLITKSIHMKRKVNLDVRVQLWYNKHGFNFKKVACQ